MSQQFLGYVQKEDPLYNYLRHDIQPLIHGAGGRAKYRVFRLNASNDVFLYEDKYTGTKFVGKFFLSGKKNTDKAAKRLTHEFDNLCTIRNCGLTGYPHHVVRPLGRNYSLNSLLITEYSKGDLLSKVILSAIHNGNERRLFYKLTALAYFLATFHNRTAVGIGVDFNHNCNYMDKLVRKLQRIGEIKDNEAGELYWLRDQWRNQEQMWEDQQVMVHGDATPENFMVGRGLRVMTFDLERSHRDDRVFDIGRIAGELKHFILRATGNKYASEPFIGHFLWEYACHFPDRDRTFRSITRRTPFYIGMTLLRIARNTWVSRTYRRCLIDEAKECLRSF
ncbi:MAG: aminoglycoside phosphotransferase family protein [Candidatus Electrothrix sp. AR3]|nr:aminoglycoside phosphotransferase family protein [Candidatus Electrothrix sp. AR3]